MKKFVKITALFMAVFFVFAGCKSKSSANTIENTVFGADITHDGNNDTIKTYLTGLESGNGSVKIFTKDTSGNRVVLWKDSVGTDSENQKGIYICKKDSEKNILIWKPTVSDKSTTLEYDIFYIHYDESSKRMSLRSLENDKISFTEDEVKKGGSKHSKATAFVKKLNKYISRSFAVIDTVGGDAMYSVKVDDRKYKLYHPSWYDKSNDPSISESTSSSSSSSSSSDDYPVNSKNL